MYGGMLSLLQNEQLKNMTKFDSKQLRCLADLFEYVYSIRGNVSFDKKELPSMKELMNYLKAESDCKDSIRKYNISRVIEILNRYINQFEKEA